MPCQGWLHTPLVYGQLDSRAAAGHFDGEDIKRQLPIGNRLTTADELSKVGASCPPVPQLGCLQRRPGDWRLRGDEGKAVDVLGGVGSTSSAARTADVPTASDVDQDRGTVTD